MRHPLFLHFSEHFLQSVLPYLTKILLQKLYHLMEFSLPVFEADLHNDDAAEEDADHLLAVALVGLFLQRFQIS